MSDIGPGEDDPLLAPGEAAAYAGVVRQTLVRWAKLGHLHPIQTLGGHRRYRRSELTALLEAAQDQRWPQPSQLATPAGTRADLREEGLPSGDSSA